MEVEATDWTARIIQHEMDHLDGQLITGQCDAYQMETVGKLTLFERL